MTKKTEDIQTIVSKVMTKRAITDSIGFDANYSFIKQVPTERQQLFLDLREEKEVFYGGAAGGAKSSALLMAALEYVHISTYAAILFRRTYVDLSRPGSLMDRAHDWLNGSGAEWKDQKRYWLFPSGATLSFGCLDSEIDKFNYQSSEFQYVGFDELSQFTETQYTYLFSRLRRIAGVKVPLRMRSGSNPGGVGGLWVKDRFVPDNFTPADAVELRVWEKQYTDEETGEQRKRFFVPARLDDNPHIDRESYDESLKELDPVTRAQLRRGDWQVTLKGDILHNWSEKQVVITWSRFWEIFGQRDSENNLLPVKPHIPMHWKIGVFQDVGSTKDHPCVTGWFATAAENSPKVNGVSIAGSVFWYRTLIKTQDVTARGIKGEIYNLMKDHDEIPRTVQWEMSHEASTERNEYHKIDNVTPYSLPFINWQTGKRRGIEQLKFSIDPQDLDLPHPFNPGVWGHPKLYIIVDDNQYISPKQELNGVDHGQYRIRAEAPAYKWDTPRDGGAPKKLEPYAMFNDAIDVARSAAAKYWPQMEEFTIDEILEQKVVQNLPFNMTNSTVLSEGQQITLSIARAKAIKQLQQEGLVDEFGLEDESSPFEGAW